MNALIVLLGLLAAALAAPAHFPHGKTVTYKYRADAKAGMMNPAPFASQFGIEGLLHVKHDVTDPTLRHAYYVALTDVKHALHNGHNIDHLSVTQPIHDVSKDIEIPFLIVYDEVGHFQGMKLKEGESTWSQNIKKSIGSMLQLDLTKIHVQTPMEHHSFITHEETIHGNCQVAYNVHTKDQMHPTSGNVFVVKKIHEPMNCTHFTHQVFNHVEPEKCYVEEEEGMTTASKRVFEIEDQGNEILIRKLIGHGVINYFPWMAQSEAHYILTNQTLILDNVATVNEVQLPVVDFQNVPITREMFFTKPQTQYVPQADVDITQGRHVVNLNDLTAKLRKMLDEAAGYLKESHIEKRQPDWKHGQTINRLLHVMSFMNVESLKQVFSELQNTKDPKEIVMRNIFLEIMPNVGTTAACLFTRNVVRQKMVPDMMARFMLAHLPMHVKVPSTELLLQMEELLHLGDSVNSGVKEASILCFASLVHRTFKTLSPNDLLLKRYLQLFMEHIKNEPTYQMKALYLMAMKNVRLVNILNVLEPIVKGEVMYSEKPASIRLLAIWAIQNVVVHHPDYAYRLLWPILSDVTLPLAMRIVSYDVLMHQLPHAGRLMSIYWFMVNEKDEHLYNYHVETIKGLANSVEPCLTPVCEMARKMLPFTRIRQVVGPLSTKVHVDYKDTKYGHGEAIKASLILHQSTGYPYVGSVEHFTTVARKPVSQWGLQWHIENLSGVVNSVKNEMTGKNVQKITRDNVREVLATAAADMPKMKDVNIHVVLTNNHNVVFVYHINSHQWLSVLKHLKEWKQFFVKQTEIINLQTIAYMNLFEMHVPTDLGVPAVLTTRIPSFNSLKLNAFLSEDENLLSLKLKAKFMRWMHGEYAMTIYNPISDVWHSTRRTMSEDVLLPLEMNVGYNRETKSLKVSVPRLPFTEYSAAGILTSAKSYVTIAHDESDLLKESCDTCRHQELVTKVVNPKINEHTYDSKDTGLKFTMAVFDCEGTATPVSPISEWLDVLRVENKNTMGYKLVQLIMGVRQGMMNNVISGQGKSCSNLIRIEPSLAYPTSAVDLTTKVTTQDLDSSHETLHFFSNKRISVRVTMDAKAASTNESVKMWDMNMHIVLSQEHVNNSMNVVVTRTTPGEKNLKICMEAVKDYKSTTTDLLNVDIGQKETNTKVTVTMGQTQGEQCVRDEMDVVLNIKGEVSEEQQKHIVQDREHSMCTQHMQNPLYQGSHVPKTWDCIQQALLHSSLRKYTTSMTMRRVPPLVVSTVNIMQDVLRSLSFPYVHYSLKHADSGNMNMVMEYPYLTDVLDATVITPTYSYELVNLPFGHNIWNILMDNSHYTVTDLYKFVNGYTKACTIYPQVVLTFDNGTIPYVVPDKWTLISGDHVDHTYSVFVKLVQNNKLAMKFFVGPHEMTVMPGDTGEMVSVNNNVIENHRKGVMVPENTPDSYAIRLTRAYSHLMIDSKVVPVQVYCAPNSVSVILETVLQGQVTGMCGHMDGTHESVLPKIYSVLHL